MRININDIISIVAKELAHSDDTQQAEFLNTFAKELQIICRDKTQNQLCYLSDRLDRDGIYLIDELYDFVALRKTQRANP